MHLIVWPDGDAGTPEAFGTGSFRKIMAEAAPVWRQTIQLGYEACSYC